MANASAKPRRNHAQQFVAGLMPEAIVHCFESVEINAQHGEHLAPALGARQSLLQAVFRNGAIRQPRERIVPGVEYQALVHIPVVPRQRDEP